MRNSDESVLASVADVSRRMAPERLRRWTRRVLGHTDLTAAQKNVVIALSTFADYLDGSDAYPGEINLAEICGLTTRAVRAALASGRKAGLIEQTAVENPRAGRAAVYRLVFNESTTGTAVPVNGVTTGTAVPVNNSITGTAVPVNNSTTGTAVPVNNSITGTATSPSPEQPFLPPSHSPKLLGLRNLGTSPAPYVPDTHTPRPSRFCEDHPQGTKQSCPACGDAREAFKAWQSEQAAIDVAIADAHRREREQLRLNCPWCHGTNNVDVDTDTVEKCDHQTPPRSRRGLSLVPPLPDALETVRAAQ